MYVPPQFNEERREVLIGAARSIQLASLVTSAEGGLHATHVPIVIRETGDDLILETHVARANQHWKLAGRETIAIFQGPHSYIHPGWYETKRETGKVVPTWTYVVVHAHGVLTAFEDRDEIIAHVATLTDQNEVSRKAPWAVADAPDQYIARMTRGIVGLRIKVDRIEGSWKLNQHKSDADKQGVTAGLAAEEDANSKAIAGLMSELGHDRSPAR